MTFWSTFPRMIYRGSSLDLSSHSSFIEHLLCASYCSKHWEFCSNKTDKHSHSPLAYMKKLKYINIYTHMYMHKNRHVWTMRWYISSKYHPVPFGLLMHAFLHITDVKITIDMVVVLCLHAIADKVRVPGWQMEVASLRAIDAWAQPPHIGEHSETNEA